jgi:hypothetical protein
MAVLQTKQQVAAVESDMGRQREALSAAVAEQRDLQGSARSTANNVETYAQVRPTPAGRPSAQRLTSTAGGCHISFAADPASHPLPRMDMSVADAVSRCPPQQASALEAELRAAKERVDLAQVRARTMAPAQYNA